MIELFFYTDDFFFRLLGERVGQIDSYYFPSVFNSIVEWKIQQIGKKIQHTEG